MDEYDYTMEELLTIFQKHAEEYEESIHKNTKLYKEMYPNDPIPEHLKNSFNLPLALWIIIAEIERLKHIVIKKKI